jgi:aryl-alcohol dehydrogenase-like predicted oxidoreductase
MAEPHSAMSLSGSYGPANDEESLKVLEKALELGCTFWDTALVYGFGHNEALLGRFFKEHPGAREKVFVASKCGWDVSAHLWWSRRMPIPDTQIDYEKKTNAGVTNSPEHILKAIDETIERLGSAPDLYYLHRIDPNTPIEESIKTLASLKAAGKTKYIGISECGAATLRKADASMLTDTCTFVLTLQSHT